MMARRYVRYCLVLLLFSLTVSVEGAEGRRYPLADGSTIVLAVPEGWRDEVRSSRQNLPPTIAYFPSSGSTFQIFITPSPLKSDGPQPTVEDLLKFLRAGFDSVKSQAVESEIKIEELKGAEVFGSYYSVTARAPERGGYKYVTQGAVVLPKLLFAGFTILTNDERNVIVPMALDMLKGVRREGVGGAAR
jgi:hypothetical protein